MRTFGRVLAAMGVVLAGVGGIGAFAMLPPPVRDSALARVEEWRQAVRAHLPEMPALGGLIAGTSEDACADAGAGDIASGAEPGFPAGEGSDQVAGCADEAPEVGVLRGGHAPDTRSSGGGALFRAPAPAGETAGD